jgi:GWxTD domain-containing protein
LISYAASRRLAIIPALVLALAWAGTTRAAPPRYEPFELINPLVGPEFTQWLVGPISWMASKKEIEGFLAIADDESASRFVERFWQERDPYPERPDNPHRELFEERAAKADSLYAEGGLPGRRTARGSIYVLYGEPEKVDHEVAPDPGDPLMEVWRYPKGHPEGLDGERPDKEYRFIKRGETTIFWERLSDAERRRRRLLERPNPRNPWR